ncbi:tRNA (5-methylaminomethyl-2-thiouridine)(34)-methyltransferase MnmD [Winogradskyella jejuensis]|uniref:tRNA U34 5-methylaminomethyl-2-thiouridine-forming methyltransferase MnmC n=1 Tax=Winogradskyella jejuensis TaxID=1089305 RepID=A0A1M5S6P7_9FLAO|nr:tRNA (5-methylaminomethyl-2-thiouridine)(34)-methyltransferase MnmD [Winogradskyella jejuensis]SHH34115.1 tRNA U34 5-methylaminomethyl-2-thiouridine-forming methyltransferase MnmC [Winogradskyella jejuensis]
MKRKIITTGDGSKTIQIEDWNEQYHSVHGAINEANHVFIKHGLLHFFNQFGHAELDSASHHNSLFDNNNQEISILEIGFGTGLNAFLTLIEAEKLKKTISYVGVEAYPVKQEEIEVLNYVDLISTQHQTKFELLHTSPWDEVITVSKYFQLKKEEKFFKDISAISKFDIVYFDAFGARVQPDLWTEDIFRLMYHAMKPSSVLVTYSAKGSVRRAMQSVGFEVERLEGPPNKRHMLRAIKR